jgi:hypothetical protein
MKERQLSRWRTVEANTNGATQYPWFRFKIKSVRTLRSKNYCYTVHNFQEGISTRNFKTLQNKASQIAEEQQHGTGKR